MKKLMTIHWLNQQRINLNDVGTFYDPSNRRRIKGQVKAIMEGRNFAYLRIQDHNGNDFIAKW